jgi:hypothetical protein
MAGRFNIDDVAARDDMNFEEGDVFTDDQGVEFVMTGGRWVRAGDTPVNRANLGETAQNLIQQSGAAVLGNVTPDSLIHGIQRGDTVSAAHARQASENQRQASARLRADAQRGFGLANRDPRVEADKDAAARASAQFQQRMAQTSGAAGGGAAVLAAMNVQDPSAQLAEHRQRADQQFLVGSQHERAAELAEQVENRERARADDINRRERDRARRNLQGAAIARGPAPLRPAEQQTAVAPVQQESEPADTAPEDKWEAISQRIDTALSSLPDDFDPEQRQLLADEGNAILVRMFELHPDLDENTELDPEIMHEWNNWATRAEEHFRPGAQGVNRNPRVSYLRNAEGNYDRRSFTARPVKRNRFQ